MPTRPLQPHEAPTDELAPEADSRLRAELEPGSGGTLPGRSGRTYHLGAAPGDIARHILLVGDPARAERAARRLAAIRYMGEHREYRIYTGSLGNLPVSVVCVGMGAGAMEIAVVELCQIVESPVLIRAGSCGSISPDLELGDLVISQGALRLESASLGYVDPGYPAFAHAEAQIALVRAAEERRVRYQLGVTATAAGFFGAQGRSVPGFDAIDKDLLERLRKQRVLNLEMEASCLLTLAALSRLRAGVVCAVFADRIRDRFITEEQLLLAEELVVDVGLTSLRHLARMERQRGEARYWHDGLGDENSLGSVPRIAPSTRRLRRGRR
jgi:uridine phosphorylase